MTAKRDLKKRIRDRQAKTGESYTTARRHVLAARDHDDRDDLRDDAEVTNPGIAKPGPTGDRFTDELAVARSRGASERVVPDDELRKLLDLRESIQVDEVIDVSDAAKELGLTCKVLVYERLAKAVEPRLALLALRDALAATDRDPSTALLRAVVAGQAHALRLAMRPTVLRDPEFMEKISAGLTAVSKDGRMIVVHVNGYAGMVTVVCAAWRQHKTLIMTTPEDRIGPVIAGFASLAGESIFLVYQGRRYQIGRKLFTIGRSKLCDLQIRDGHVSRKHAAITWQSGAYYLVDLDSTSGIEHRGVRIRNKRIEEGDMFMLNEYALRFTFHETDA